MATKDALTILGRPINGISLNGLEYLLNQEGTDYMYFKNKEEARNFLRENVFPDSTDEELEDYFMFKRVIYQTVCDDHHGGDIVDDIFPNRLEAEKRFNELKESHGYCRYEEIFILEDDTIDEDTTHVMESYFSEDEICPNCGSGDISKNSSGDIQCENCGFDEGNDTPKSN
jgi:hypothetical protein